MPPNTAFGLNDPHYFLGKTEILGWINDSLGLRLNKVEETCNGAVACQLLDVLHPGLISMAKIDFNARDEYQMLSNYKVLQDAFTKLKVDKHIEVAKLVKGRPLDNMEFMQWFRAYWDQVTVGQPVAVDYDGPARRQQCKTGDVKYGPGTRPQQALAGGAKGVTTVVAAAPRVVSQPSAGASKPMGGGAKVLSPDRDRDQVDKLSHQLDSLRLRADGFEKEKEFYYSKLRDVELLCQTPVVVDMPIMRYVQQVLYAATAEEGNAITRKAQVDFAGREYTEEELPQ